MANKPFDWCPVFLAALRRVPVLSQAAEAAGIDRTTAWRRMQDDPEFKAQVDEAMEEGIDCAEQEAFRRAVAGFEEPVIYKGALQYVYERYIDEETGEEKFRPRLDANGQPIPLTVRKHSDALLVTILKGRRKKVYAERTEVTGADGGAVVVDETKRAARIAALMEAAKRRKQTADDFSDIA